jgi:hypothetical protein
MKRAYRLAAVSSRLFWLGTTLLLLPGSAIQAQTPGPRFINPPALTRPTGYTHVVVMKTTTFLTDLKNLPALRDTRARYFDAAHPPANTLVPVTTLARPDLLLEIEAVVDLPRP